MLEEKGIFIKFPSPYGVSFILMFRYNYFIILRGSFPSPYGVSFILMYDILDYQKEIEDFVSVSLRSIVHSYNSSLSFPLSFSTSVSVSLRSIVHSYFIDHILDYGEMIDVSVSLRSIVHSYYLSSY